MLIGVSSRVQTGQPYRRSKKRPLVFRHGLPFSDCRPRRFYRLDNFCLYVPVDLLHALLALFYAVLRVNRGKVSPVPLCADPSLICAVIQQIPGYNPSRSFVQLFTCVYNYRPLLLSFACRCLSLLRFASRCFVLLKFASKCFVLLRVCFVLLRVCFRSF